MYTPRWAVIGADGFGFAPTKDGEYIKIYQNGDVVVGDRVEIGANSKSIGLSLVNTIEDGVKIDNRSSDWTQSIVGENSVLSGPDGNCRL